MSADFAHLDNDRIRYQVDIRACYAAVREGFPHLSVRDIVDPPHHWFDAALARQIVYFLMVREFHWPKRRVVESERRSREAINRSLRTIDDRLLSPRFFAHYDRIRQTAHQLLAGINVHDHDEEAA